MARKRRHDQSGNALLQQLLERRRMDLLNAPSPAQWAVLENLHHGRPPFEHLHREGEHLGAGSTVRAMAERGWLTPEGRLTDAGRRLCGELFAAAPEEGEAPT